MGSHTPIEEDAAVNLLKWEDEEGKHAYWHSSAHLMAEALQDLYRASNSASDPPLKMDSTTMWIPVKV